MKIGGVIAVPPTEEEPLVLPRKPHPIVFRARAIPDMEEFFQLCPEPKPPGRLTKNGWEPDPDAPGYVDLIEAHAKQRMAYMVIKTLEPSDIEWDRVKPDNPKTWVHWESDLRTVLTQIEINLVTQLVIDANQLNEDKLVKAREVFLLGQAQAPSDSLSPSSEPESSPSGEPAPASE